MGLLRRLLRPQPSPLILTGDGSYPQECKGESHYTRALLEVARPYLTRDEPNDEGGRSYEAFGVPVRLVAEPHNPADANAVKVTTLRGLTLGYIPREDAPRVARRLAEIGRPVQCLATIRGLSRSAHRLNLGIWLDVDL